MFSPARRASRKLLERIVEFIKVLDCESMICEYNQEACRLDSFEKGKKSLIRSFPCARARPHAHPRAHLRDSRLTASRCAVRTAPKLGFADARLEPGLDRVVRGAC